MWELVTRIEADPSVDGSEKVSIGDVRAYVGDPRWWMLYFMSSQPGRILIVAIIPR